MGLIKKFFGAKKTVPGSIDVLWPRQAMVVHVRSLVVGKVSGPVSEIWVVVRPKQTDDYWVTRGIGTIRSTFWLMEIRFGRDGNV